MENILDDLDLLIIEKLKLGVIDFIDAGCGIGGSIDFCRSVFNAENGIGFDLDEKKIEQAQNNDYLVFCKDILEFDFPPKSVRFASMMDFLEHLPNIDSAREILKTLGNASKDFLFIRHPNFDDIKYLKKYGLKLTWTDWSGHKNMMTIADFCNVFNEFGWNDYKIIPRNIIKNSMEEVIIPEDAPKNINKFSQLSEYNKNYIAFDKPVYYQYDIFVKLNPNLSTTIWNNLGINLIQ